MASPNRRLSKASQRVLSALYDAAPNQMYGMELMDAASAPSGTLYPILARFRDRDWLEAEYESIDSSEAGRPPRTYYRLTPDGLAVARNLAVSRGAVGVPSWGTGSR